MISYNTQAKDKNINNAWYRVNFYCNQIVEIKNKPFFGVTRTKKKKNQTRFVKIFSKISIRFFVTPIFYQTTKSLLRHRVFFNKTSEPPEWHSTLS